MIAKGSLPQSGTEGIEGKGKGTSEPISCGCVVAPATKSRGRQVLTRCEEGERLWSELRSARDARFESLDHATHGRRRGARTREGREILDRFLGARDTYQLHVFGEVIG
jgi:hypothetical protein